MREDLGRVLVEGFLNGNFVDEYLVIVREELGYHFGEGWIEEDDMFWISVNENVQSQFQGLLILEDIDYKVSST